MLFGISGTILIQKAIKYKFKIPKHVDSISDDKYMNTIFIDKLKKVLKDENVTEIDKNQEDTNSNLIVGYKGKIYLISCDLSICEFNSTFLAIGSGRAYATGALESIKEGEPIREENIRCAIKVAAKYNFYCDDNIDIVKL